MAGGTKGTEGSSSGSVDLGVEQLHDLGKSSQDKILSTHLVDKVVRLAGSLTDSLVDSGAGLLGHVGALLLVLGAALLLVLRGASLAGSIIIIIIIIIITCSYSVVQACRGAARQMFSVTCSHTSSVLGWCQGL